MVPSFGSDEFAIAIVFNSDAVTYEACKYRPRRGQASGGTTNPDGGNGGRTGAPAKQTQRLISALREYPAGLTKEQLAPMLGIKADSVKKAIERARKDGYDISPGPTYRLLGMPLDAGDTQRRQ